VSFPLVHDTVVAFQRYLYERRGRLMRCLTPAEVADPGRTFSPEANTVGAAGVS
jgi:hypothetical protein